MMIFSQFCCEYDVSVDLDNYYLVFRTVTENSLLRGSVYYDSWFSWTSLIVAAPRFVIICLIEEGL